MMCIQPHAYCLYTCTLYMYCISHVLTHLQPASKSLIYVLNIIYAAVAIRESYPSKGPQHQVVSGALPVCLSRGFPGCSDYPPGPPGTLRYWSRSDTRRVRRTWKRNSEEWPNDPLSNPCCQSRHKISPVNKTLRWIRQEPEFSAMYVRAEHYIIVKLVLWHN